MSKAKTVLKNMGAAVNASRARSASKRGSYSTKKAIEADADVKNYSDSRNQLGPKLRRNKHRKDALKAINDTFKHTAKVKKSTRNR